MHSLSMSMTVGAGGTSTKLAISGVSAQSVACVGNTVVVTPDTDCFVRLGANPVALVDVDQLLLARNTYRLSVAAGQKLAFITAGSAGNAYINQEG